MLLGNAGVCEARGEACGKEEGLVFLVADERLTYYRDEFMGGNVDDDTALL